MPDIEAIRAAAEELKALSEKRSRGQWSVRYTSIVSDHGGLIAQAPADLYPGGSRNFYQEECDEANLAYIVAACNLAPALLALTDSLTAERDELRRENERLTEQVTGLQGLSMMNESVIATLEARCALLTNRLAVLEASEALFSAIDDQSIAQRREGE